MLKGAFIFWQKAVAERLNTNLSKSWEMCTNYHTNCAQHRTLAARKTSAGLGATGRSAASSWCTFPQPIPPWCWGHRAQGPPLPTPTSTLCAQKPYTTIANKRCEGTEPAGRSSPDAPSKNKGANAQSIYWRIATAMI